MGPHHPSMHGVLRLIVTLDGEDIVDCESILERVKGIGVIGGEEAINWGLSGPMLRASRIKWDLWKVDHYEWGK
ncbi:hypothetical protein Gohar_027403 [Gossypium harknessii]|uniref:NADH-quinone oxidoreductase subunit D domain-containing protein n=1 Tax=Gossypium harknessii TaxID=34285 RepID=A0A7J9HV61_9ROSI|nr:hypothetical protein [Gossypium harknessii]